MEKGQRWGRLHPHVLLSGFLTPDEVGLCRQKPEHKLAKDKGTDRHPRKVPGVLGRRDAGIRQRLQAQFPLRLSAL